MGPLVASRGIEAGEELVHLDAAAGGAGSAGDVPVSQKQLIDLAAGAAAEIVKRHLCPVLPIRELDTSKIIAYALK